MEQSLISRAHWEQRRLLTKGMSFHKEGECRSISAKMATLKNKRKLATATRESQEKHPRNGQSRKTSVPRINEECITKFLRRLKTESIKNCLRSSAGQSPTFWVLCPICTNSSWTHRYERIPEPFRELSGTQAWKTRERMRTTPRVILILKQASSAATLHKILAQKLVLTASLKA